MTGHKNRLSNHRFITFYHVPCPHVLMSFSSQCLQDHGRPGRILLDGEVYKCSLVGQLSKSRHCHSFKHFGCVVMQTVWNPICFFMFFSEVWCSMQVPSCPFSANNHSRWTIVQHPLCPMPPFEALDGSRTTWSAPFRPLAQGIRDQCK